MDISCSDWIYCLYLMFYLQINMPIRAQHQGTTFEFTVVLMFHRAVTDKGGVILCRGLFLLLFCRSATKIPITIGREAKKDKKPAAGDKTI